MKDGPSSTGTYRQAAVTARSDTHSLAQRCMFQGRYIGVLAQVALSSTSSHGLSWASSTPQFIRLATSRRSLSDFNLFLAWVGYPTPGAGAA